MRHIVWGRLSDVNHLHRGASVGNLTQVDPLCRRCGVVKLIVRAPIARFPRGRRSGRALLVSGPRADDRVNRHIQARPGLSQVKPGLEPRARGPAGQAWRDRGRTRADRQRPSTANARRPPTSAPGGAPARCPASTRQGSDPQGPRAPAKSWRRLVRSLCSAASDDSSGALDLGRPVGRTAPIPESHIHA